MAIGVTISTSSSYVMTDPQRDHSNGGNDGNEGSNGFVISNTGKCGNGGDASIVGINSSINNTACNTINIISDNNPVFCTGTSFDPSIFKGNITGGHGDHGGHGGHGGNSGNSIIITGRSNVGNGGFDGTNNN